jgi:hypothetical protein
MKIASSLLILSSLLACGCASSGGGESPRERLVVVRPCAVTCSGSIGAEREGDPPAELTPSNDGARFSAHVGVARLKQAEADALFGSVPRVADAAVVTTESAQRALASAVGLVPGHPFTSGDREAGFVAVESQRSYVERFELTTSDAAFILDPQIGVYSIGQRLTLRPSTNEADGSWTVELALCSIDDCRPAIATAANVLGSDSDVSVQFPLLARVETRTTATLAHGESLVVVSPELLRGDSVVVAVVTPDL